jgi:hypothetical protein
MGFGLVRLRLTTGETWTDGTFAGDAWDSFFLIFGDPQFVAKQSQSLRFLAVLWVNVSLPYCSQLKITIQSTT